MLRVFCAWPGLSHLAAEGADWASLKPPHLESLILNFPGRGREATFKKKIMSCQLRTAEIMSCQL